MGDHILVSVDGEMVRVSSEILDVKKVGNFVSQKDGGIFVYDQNIASKEQFARFEKGIKAAIDKIRKGYGY